MEIGDLLSRLSKINLEEKVYLKAILKERNIEELKRILDSLAIKYKLHEFADPVVELEKPGALKLIQRWYVATILKKDPNFLIREVDCIESLEDYLEVEVVEEEIMLPRKKVPSFNPPQPTPSKKYPQDTNTIYMVIRKKKK